MDNKYRYLRDHLRGQGALESPFRAWALENPPLDAPSIYNLKGRRLNNFCIGSDPEFAFRHPHERDRIAAWDAGLKVGLAAGCDQNERLVELRPWPSPSVVEHVAGILCALRWLHRVYPQTRALEWRAGAFFSGDGIGGHVHFGRKRPSRPEEIAALDGLARVFGAARMFPNDEWRLRIRGDRLGQIYGAPGDFRVQNHGYEYRSLPSWLVSPTVAFTALAASKLAILDPDLTASWAPKLPQQTARDLLRGLAKLYRSRDDDAYLLYHTLTKDGYAVFEWDHTQNFAGNWGIPVGDVVVAETGVILPASIKPAASEVEEIQDHLLRGTKLGFVRLPASFKTSVPDGYTWVPNRIHPGRRSGFGDFLHNLVMHTEAVFEISHVNAGALSISGALVGLLTPAERDILKSTYPDKLLLAEGMGPSSITITKDMCQATTIGETRWALVQCKMFPLWTVDSVTPTSYQEWLAAHPVLPKKWRNI